MQLFVYNRGAIEATKPFETPHAIISIVTSPGDNDHPKLPQNDKTFKTLRLIFDDTDSQKNDSGKPFNIQHAFWIWDFVLDAKKVGVDTFLLHCDAGQCRSPAVAAAISKVMLGDDMSFFKRYRPNMLVYRTLLDAWYDNYEPDQDD